MSPRHFATFLALLWCLTSRAADPPRVDADGDPLPDGARTRLGTSRWRLPGYSRSAVLSPDGKTIYADNGSAGAILRIDAATGRMIEPVPGGMRTGSEGLLLSRDGRRLVGCGYDGVWVWDMTERKQIGRIGINRAGSETYALADGGGFVATSARFPGPMQERGKVVVYELPSGKVAGTVEPLQNESVQAALSPDGKLMATFGRYYDRANPGNQRPDNTSSIIQIWHVASAKEKSRITTGSAYIAAARFSPDGQTLATSGFGSMIQLWDVASGKAVRQFAARTGQGVRLCFSPDGKQLASTGQDGSIQLWDTATGRRLGLCESVCPQVADLVFPPGAPPIALSRRNNALVLWMVPDGKRLTPDGGHTLAPTAMQFTPDGKMLLSTDSEGRVLRWDAAAGKELEATPLRVTNDAYSRSIGRRYFAAAEFAPSARWLALANDSGNRALYDVKSGTEIFTFAAGTPSHSRENRLTFSANEARAAVLSHVRGRAVNTSECLTHVWDVESGQLVGTWPVSWVDMNYDSNTIGTLSPNGERLVVVGLSRAGNSQQVSAGALDVATGKMLGRYNCPSGYVPFAPVIRPDNRSVLLPGPNGQAVVWDLLSGAVGQTVAVGKRFTNIAPRLAANGRFVVFVASETRTDTSMQFAVTYLQHSIVVAEWASGETRLEFPLLDRVAVVSLALSPDGNTIAAGCSDTTIVLYDISSAGAKSSQQESKPADVWQRLASGTAAQAWPVIAALRARSDLALPLLREHLRPAAAKLRPKLATIVKWIAQLDAANFGQREEAERQLIASGEFVTKEVRAALAKPPSQEVKRRLERVVAVLDKPVVLSVAEARGLELLEALGTKEALEHLRTLAAGDPSSALTRDAKLTLERMSAKPQK